MVFLPGRVESATVKQLETHEKGGIVYAWRKCSLGFSLADLRTELPWLFAVLGMNPQI